MERCANRLNVLQEPLLFDSRLDLYRNESVQADIEIDIGVTVGDTRDGSELFA